MHILVVDDEQVWRDRLSREIRRHDFTFDEASDGLPALHLLASNAYDVVLLDIMMPRMDGFEVLARMRQTPEWAATPVVLLAPKPADESFTCWEGHPARLTVRKDKLDDIAGFIRELPSLLASCESAHVDDGSSS